MKNFLVLFLFLITISTLFSSPLDVPLKNVETVVTDNPSQSLTVTFSTDTELKTNLISRYSENTVSIQSILPDEGTTMDSGRPLLPAVSRFVVVPPQAGLVFLASSIRPERTRLEKAPLMLSPEDYPGTAGNDYEGDPGLYPPDIAVMSEPVVIRGVRLVKITSYPFQYDAASGELIHNAQIQTRIEYTNTEPVNPVLHPDRRGRSAQFLKFIESLAVNGDIVRRDDPARDATGGYPGHYLIVTHENCLEYAVPFIEWRRKGGYRVDILNIPEEVAGDEEAIKELIQERYDDYLDDGVDPFDHILLIGDRDEYFGGADARWILGTFQGESIWPRPDHADFLFACLEGNDHHPDVAVSRLPSGNPDAMELAIGRTLAYEAEPCMDEPEWFTRGAVFSQHFGNMANAYWEPYFNTNVRWAEQVLLRHGFEDVAFYENFEWDIRGDDIHPFLRDCYNDGRNLLVGIASSFHWRQEFVDVEDNVVFPIHLTLGEHGEATGHNIFRTGSAEHLLGAVATTATYGDIMDTSPLCARWTEMVSGFVNHDLSFGWARNYAIIGIENYFPNIDIQGGRLYEVVKTDLDFMGDPGIQPWIGVPVMVEADFPNIITPTVSCIDIYVSDTANDEPVAGATVSLYAPGEIPAPGDDEYADYDDVVQLTATTDDEGIARFVPGESVEFISDTPVYVTVSGRNIRPFFGEMDVQETPSFVELSSYELAEVDGNGDDHLNPDEAFDLLLTAVNLSVDDEQRQVSATVFSQSAWVEVEEVEIEFAPMGPGDVEVGDRAVRLTLSPAIPDGRAYPAERPLLTIEFVSGNETWTSAIELDPWSPKYTLREVAGDPLIPAADRNLDLVIENSGRMNSPSFSVTLETLDQGIAVIQAESSYPEIPAGESSPLSGADFVIIGAMYAPPGFINPMQMMARTEGGFEDIILFDLQVREPEQNTPQAPDDYGYICYDDTDADWIIAPEFEWEEISPVEENRHFDGTELEFERESVDDIGESIVVNLPFETQFYGEIFDQMTICTKGFIAVGDQPRITSYQPYPMDRALGGGAGMISPFWADLDLTDNSHIYTFYDEDESRFIIEWYKMRHLIDNDEDLTFQVILYDHDVWISESGDQMMLFQYNEIDNPQNIRNLEWRRNIPYASVGISSPDGTSGVNYTFGNTYPITSAELEPGRAILFSRDMRIRMAMIRGHATDAETGEPIVGAVAMTMHGIVSQTDEEGLFRLEVMTEFAVVSVSAQGYNSQTIEFEGLEDNEVREVEIALTHPEFNLSEVAIETSEEMGRQAEVSIDISNAGNGPLEWTAEKHLIGDADRDPWELRSSLPVGAERNDGRVQGAIFADDHFYISGANENNLTIYIYNREGEFTGQFAQPEQDDRRGFRDLAYDGELIWGAVGDQVYGIDLEGEVVFHWESIYNPTVAITWDSERELIWLSSTTTDPVAFTREGEKQDALLINRNNLRIYGMAFWADDPDGYDIYSFNKDRETGDQVVYKHHPESGDSMFVTFLYPESGGDPAGAFITEQLDQYSWAFVSVISNSSDEGGDQVNVWQLDVNTAWLNLDRYAGRIEADNSDELTLTLDATELEISLYEAELRFTHNADSGLAILPVSFDVLDPDDVSGGEGALAYEFRIGSAYPNPFNSTIRIQYSLNESSLSEIKVFDLGGREIAIISEASHAPGVYSAVWDAEGLASGVYIVRLTAGLQSESRKVVLVR